MTSPVEAALYDIATRAHAWYVMGPDGPPSVCYVAQAASVLARDVCVENDKETVRGCSHNETALAAFWRLIGLIEAAAASGDNVDSGGGLFAVSERAADDAHALRTQLLHIVAMMLLI